MILPAPVPVQPLIYSTMPSYWANRPELAMDGDEGTAFRAYKGMSTGDSFVVLLSRPVGVRSIRVSTGDANGEGLFAGTLEVSADGTTFKKAADFDAAGIAQAKGLKDVAVIRLKTARRRRDSGLTVREIKIDSEEPFAPALRGPGRGFVDLNGFNDVKAWAARAESQMESFWAETDALLYSDGFVPPNAVNVVYRDDKGLPPGMNGGGVMTVDVNWARKHADDTGLTVHEMAHSVQAGGSPGWLVEATADYIRWIKFEPQNFTYRIDPKQPPQQPYRAGAAFLAYCELRYDSKLVTKLYDAARFGRYSDALFTKFCGKDINTLYKEFLTDYARDPKGVLVAPVSDSLRPRDLPIVTPGSGRPVEMPYDTVGVTVDGTKVRTNGGFDGEGSTYSATGLGKSVTVNGVRFEPGPASGSNALAAHGQTIRLSGRHRSLWILASAIEGGQRDQTLTVTYTDGTTAKLSQSFSDWYEPANFPGEVRAVRMGYRNLPNGTRDERPFNAYAYGFALDRSKEIQSVTLPDNANVRVLGISVAD